MNEQCDFKKLIGEKSYVGWILHYCVCMCVSTQIVIKQSQMDQSNVVFIYFMDTRYFLAYMGLLFDKFRLSF